MWICMQRQALTFGTKSVSHRANEEFCHEGGGAKVTLSAKLETVVLKSEFVTNLNNRL